jgi:hypothetical protein
VKTILVPTEDNKAMGSALETAVLRWDPSDDCEDVARVILGADMNMRQSFKPK